MNGTRMRKLGALALALFCVGITTERASAKSGACSKTVKAAYSACKSEVRGDYLIAVGKCNNIEDRVKRQECLADAKAELAANKALCKEQRDARLKVCDRLGQDTHEPEVNPAEFVDFDAVIAETEAFTPNPYFSLVAGTVREFHVLDANDGNVERVLVEVLEETREILGVSCMVICDRVYEVDGAEETLLEDTKDWLAQHTASGDVWYFGEEAKDYENDALISIDGSFEAGRDSAHPGIWVLSAPEAGDFYRQEFALSEAEDVADVISVGEESVTVPTGTYDTGILKTKDSSPLDPGAFEFKFYAPGVGWVSSRRPIPSPASGLC